MLIEMLYKTCMTSNTNRYIKVTHSQYSYKNGLQFNNKYENK